MHSHQATNQCIKARPACQLATARRQAGHQQASVARLSPADSHASSGQPWYDQPGPVALRETLQLPSWRFQTLVQQEPRVLSYQPHTLQLTLDALAAGLHSNPKDVVRIIIEQRPALLLQPQEAVQVLQYLARLLNRSPQQTAFLLAPHPQLLSMPLPQLQQHIQDVCAVMHWPNNNDLTQSALSTSSTAAVAAVAAAGPVSFIQLLALPVAHTAAHIQDLRTALDASECVAAQLVQHHPALLNMSPAVLRSRLFAVAEAHGSSCSQLLDSLDPQQLRGLSGLLLLSPHRLTAQLQGLQALLATLQQPSQQQQQQQREAVSAATADAGTGSNSSNSSNLAARLLLRMGTRSSLADAQVKLVLLQSVVRRVQSWQHQLCSADDCQLAALLAADHEGLAQAQYLASVLAAGGGGGVEAGGGGGSSDRVDVGQQWSLLQTVLMPAAEFRGRWQGYAVWPSGGSSSGGAATTHP